MYQLRFSIFALAVVVMTAASSSFTFAQSSESGRLSLSERIARLEQQAGQSTNQGNIDLVNQLTELQSQVQVLQGQIEELKHQVDESKERNRVQITDFSSRIERLEGRSGLAAPSAGSSTSSPPVLEDVPLGSPKEDGTVSSDPTTGNPPVQESPSRPSPASTKPPTTTPTGDPAAAKAAYDEAFAALKDGRYAESARRFKAFTESYPNSDLTSNAYYWLGESYYVTQNYRVSLDTFQKLLKQFPSSSKAADALLKVGYCQYELKQWDAAEATLNQVVQKYPDTTVARLAQGRLRALKLESKH